MANDTSAPKAPAAATTAPAASANAPANNTANSRAAAAAEPFVTGKASAPAAGAKPAGTSDAKKPDTRKDTPGNDYKSVISNLAQMASFANMRSVIGDASFWVADKVVTLAKKAWNGLFAKLESISLRDAVIRIFGSALKPFGGIAKFAWGRVKRAFGINQGDDRQGPKGPGVKAGTDAGVPGLTNAAVAPPSQANTSQTQLPPRRSLGQSFTQGRPETARRPQGQHSSGPSSKNDIASQLLSRERNTLNKRAF